MKTLTAAEFRQKEDQAFGITFAALEKSFLSNELPYQPAIFRMEWRNFGFGDGRHGYLMAYVGGRHYGASGTVSEAAALLAREAIDWELANPPKTLRLGMFFLITYRRRMETLPFVGGLPILTMDRIRERYFGYKPSVCLEDFMRRAEWCKLLWFLRDGVRNDKDAMLAWERDLAFMHRLLKLDEVDAVIPK